jgi:hypothetical protein
MTQSGADPAGSDDEIYGLLRRIMAEHQRDSATPLSATIPTRAPMQLRSTSEGSVRRDPSFEEILQKIRGDIANE